MKTVTRTCKHRVGVEVEYISNDPHSPPVILIKGPYSPFAYASVISLTNQVIRVSCPICFDEIRQAATKLSPDIWQLPQ
jgi:hypothetical protein